MAAPRTTHLKRQKERARQERQQEKAQRRQERKAQAPAAPTGERGPVKIEYDEFGQPIPLDFHDF
jgi:hypothetical protein